MLAPRATSDARLIQEPAVGGQVGRSNGWSAPGRVGLAPAVANRQDGPTKAHRESLACAIDDMLDRQTATPLGFVREVAHAGPCSALGSALALTLQSRGRIAETLSTLSTAGGDDVDFPADQYAARTFGRRLAQAWAGLWGPYSRASLFHDLGRIEAARIGGLLKHLEWTVEADPCIKAASLLDSPAPRFTIQPPLLPDLMQASGPQMAQPLRGGMPVALCLQENPTEELEPNAADSFNPEQVMAFRQRVEAVHGSMAAGFKAMDISQRGLISFGDFHAHLVRLHLCKVDAESSRKALDLFKQLDVDLDDFISPQDVAWAMALAAKGAGREPADDRWQATLRFPTRPKVSAEEALSLVTFQRYLEVRFGSFLAGLHAMDIEWTGQISKASFTRQLLQADYCTSVQEAVSLFQALDVHSQNMLTLRDIAAMEASGELWLDLPIAPAVKAFDGGPAYQGGCFSEPPRLSDPPPLRRIRPRSRSAYVPEEVYLRLANATTGQLRENRSHQGASLASSRAASPFVAAERQRRGGRSTSPGNKNEDLFSRMDTNKDGKLSRDEVKGFALLEDNFDKLDLDHDGYISRKEFASGYGGIHTSGRANSAGLTDSRKPTQGRPNPATSRLEPRPPPPPRADPAPNPPTVPGQRLPTRQSARSSTKASAKEEPPPEPDLTKAKEVKSVGGLAEAAKDAHKADAVRDKLRQRRQKKGEKQSGEAEKTEASAAPAEEESSFYSYFFGESTTEPAANEPAAQSGTSEALRPPPPEAGGADKPPERKASTSSRASRKSTSATRTGGNAGFNVGVAAAAMRRSARARRPASSEAGEAGKEGT